jgi:hypothetical protein
MNLKHKYMIVNVLNKTFHGSYHSRNYRPGGWDYRREIPICEKHYKKD